MGHECLGQIEAEHDWPSGKVQHHQLELLQDHRAEILLTGTQYVCVVDLLISAPLLSVLLQGLQDQLQVQKTAGVKHELSLLQESLR